MDAMAKEFALKALNLRIDRLPEYIEWQKKVIRDNERSLATKKGSTQNAGSIGVSIEYSEDVSTRLIQKAKANLEKAEENLAGYIHAKEQIMKM